MTRTGWILTWIVAAVGALLIALVLFIALFNWNRARPWLDQRLGSSIGRPVAINGDLTVDWLRNPDAHGLSNWIPWPRFVARDISIANPDWAKQPRFATVQEVRFSLSPLALLGHTIDIPSLKLIGPSVDVERDKQDRDNWTFNFAKGSGGKWKLDIGEVALGAGKIRMDDAKLDLHLDFTVTPLGKPIPFSEIVPAKSSAPGSAPPPHSNQKYYFAWTAKGTWRGADASGSGKLGSVLALSNAATPFPLQADLRLRDLHIAVVGTLTDPVHLGALDMDLEMSGESMSHLYALTGVALPPTKPFSTHGRLFARVHQGIFKYDHFDGKVGHSDLHGSATYATAGPRPKLTATLTSNVLDFGDLSPLIGADSNAAKAQRGESQKQPADKLLPVETFDTTRWRKMDADVHFTGKRIVRKSNLPISDLSTHLVLDDGVLTLDPFALSAAGGDLKANITLDGRRNPMHGEATLSLRHLKLNRLFPTVDLMHTSLGQINGDAKLDGDGNSVAGLLGTSDGEVKILINNGAVSKLLLEEIGLNIGNIIITKLVGDKPEKLNCAAADLVAKQGVWRPQIFVIDTDTMTINVDGSINLANETLDMTIHPHSKGVRVLSLRSPLYLRGTLKHPDAGVEKGPLLARGVGAAVLGAVAAPVAALAALIAPSHDEDNACRGVIQAMRKPATQH
ncbi:MAG TPA: AsmA family protein [Rhodanobacteraceae bacterium]|nr:AsmA family protein [Rhodanobacteraceae bacterium]